MNIYNKMLIEHAKSCLKTSENIIEDIYSIANKIDYTDDRESIIDITTYLNNIVMCERIKNNKINGGR